MCIALVILFLSLLHAGAQEDFELSHVPDEFTEHQMHRAHQTIEMAQRLAEMGEGSVAVRMLSKLVEQGAHPEIKEQAEHHLKQWNLDLDTIRDLSADEVTLRIQAAMHRGHQHHIQMLHIQNLVQLGAYKQAAEALRKGMDGFKDEVTDSGWEWIESLALPIEQMSGASVAQWAQSLKKGHQRQRLGQRLRLLMSTDHELAELASMAWHSHVRSSSHDEFEEENEYPPLSEILRELNHRMEHLSLKDPSSIEIIRQLLDLLKDHSTLADDMLMQLPSIETPLKQSATFRKPEGEDPGEVIFGHPQIHQYEIELNEEAVELLQEEAKQYVRGTFIAHGERYENVGIRLKGSWGSFRELNEHSKTAFTIKFNHYEKGKRFKGLRRIILNNAVQDPSYLREGLGYGIFRDAGIPAPRVSYALLKLNGKQKGLYVQVEAVTKDYLKRWYSMVGGNLYEGPGDIAEWRELDLDSNQDREDRSDLRQLNRAIEEADDEHPWATLSKYVDYDHFTRFVAVEQILNHWDGYTEVNNYRLYHNPESDLFEFLPHGCDQLFEHSFESIYRSQGGILGRALLQTEQGKKDYDSAVQSIMDTVWDEDRLRNRIAQYYLLVRPHLVDPADRDQLDAFENTIRHVLHFISNRGHVIRYHLRMNDSENNWRKRQHHEHALHYMLEGEWE